MSRGKGAHKLGADFKQEDILLAVVIVDNFEQTFSPLTLTRPRALLPLVNAPLIEYTLECLCAGGVQQAILYCCSHAEQVRRYITGSKWLRDGAEMPVLLVTAEECRSVGDVLRDLENKALVHSDFVLVSADLVASVKLTSVVEEHKKRRAASKKAIMTMVYKQVPPGHPTRVPRHDLVLALHQDTHQIVGYQRVPPPAATPQAPGRKFRLPVRVFDAPSVQLRFDLLDCRIAVCSPVVPQLMTDDFDFQTLDDLVRGVLQSEEILDHALHAHVLEGGQSGGGGGQYAASVWDEDSYAAVSQDVMGRWAYPLTPDCITLGGAGGEESRYVYERRNVYLQRDVTLERGCVLERNVALATSCHVDADARISRSVLGRRCIVGKNSRVIDSFLLDDVRLGDSSVVTRSIIDSGVAVGSGARVGPYCLLGAGVVIAPGAVVAPRTELVTRAMLIEARRIGVIDESVVTQYVPYPSGGTDTLSRVTAAPDGTGWHVARDVSEGEDDASSEGGEVGETNVDGGEGVSDDVCYSEVVGTLQRARSEDIATDNVILEINSVKHAYGLQIHELTMLLARALLDLPLKSCHAASATIPTPNQYVTCFRAEFERFKPLLGNYVKVAGLARDALFAMEQFCASDPVAVGGFAAILAYLYKVDVMSEEGILMWWAAGGEVGCDAKVRSRAAPFVEWLQTAEEEDDSD